MDMLDRDLRACRAGRSLCGVLQLAAILAGRDDEGKCVTCGIWCWWVCCPAYDNDTKSRIG